MITMSVVISLSLSSFVSEKKKQMLVIGHGVSYINCTFIVLGAFVLTWRICNIERAIQMHVIGHSVGYINCKNTS